MLCLICFSLKIIIFRIIFIKLWDNLPKIKALRFIYIYIYITSLILMKIKLTFLFIWSSSNLDSMEREERIAYYYVHYTELYNPVNFTKLET